MFQAVLAFALLFVPIWGHRMSPNFYCKNLKPQNPVLIDELMGTWYGIEVIPHRDLQHQVIKSTSCPIINISEYKEISYYLPNHQKRDTMKQSENLNLDSNTTDSITAITNEIKDNRTEDFTTSTIPITTIRPTTIHRESYPPWQKIKLTWNEAAISVEYLLKFTSASPGLWITLVPEHNFLINWSSRIVATVYAEVHVIKAAGNHLVLTFCQRKPQEQLFTVLLARETRLDSVEADTVHSMLNERGLSTSSIVKASCNRSEV